MNRVLRLHTTLPIAEVSAPQADRLSLVGLPGWRTRQSSVAKTMDKAALVQYFTAHGLTKTCACFLEESKETGEEAVGMRPRSVNLYVLGCCCAMCRIH